MHLTNTPETDVGVVDLEMSDDLKSSLASWVNDDLQRAKSDRFIKDATLDYWNDMLEMNVGERNEPWPNCSNVCVPIVKMMHQGVHSRLASAVFVPRMYVANPLTDEAAAFSHQTENYYNAEYHRHLWIRPHLDAVSLSLRDGVAIGEVLWEERIVTKKVVFLQNGPPGKDGKPTKIKEIREAEIVVNKGPKMEAIEYRDLILSPASARSIQAASSVYRRLYLSEQDLWDMVASGDMWKESVENILSNHSPGENDLARSDGGSATYQQGGTIQVGDEGSGGDTEGPGKRSRGTFEIWRVHTNAWDLDGDGVFEENVLFFYENRPELLGASHYKYWMLERPFASCAPMPRPNRFEGFSIPELTRGEQEEANATHNRRNDAADLQVFAGMYQTPNAECLTPDTPVGPKARWKVQNKDDVGAISYGTVDPSQWQEENLLFNYATKIAGLEAPSMPTMGNQKIPQKQQMAQQTASNVQLDLMALEVRLFCEKMLWMAHQLNIQYMSDDEENDLKGTGVETIGTDKKKFKLPYEALIQDIALSVAGTQGSLDKESRSNDIKVLYSLLMQSPLVQGNLERVHSLTSYVLDDYNIPEYSRFIGSVEDAKKQQEQMAQAAKAKHDEDIQMAMLQHSKVDPKAAQPPGAPPGGGGPAPMPGPSGPPQ